MQDNSPTHMNESVLLTAHDIDATVRRLATAIKPAVSCDRVGYIVVLNGAIHFASAFLRHFAQDGILSYARVDSYHGKRRRDATTSIQWIGKEDLALAKTLIVLEDIVDTGATLQELLGDPIFQNKQIMVVTLLTKRTSLSGVSQFYYGTCIPAHSFVYGYGMDENNGGRHVPTIMQKGTIHDQ